MFRLKHFTILLFIIFVNDLYSNVVAAQSTGSGSSQQVTKDPSKNASIVNTPSSKPKPTPKPTTTTSAPTSAPAPRPIIPKGTVETGVIIISTLFATCCVSCFCWYRWNRKRRYAMWADEYVEDYVQL